MKKQTVIFVTFIIVLLPFYSNGQSITPDQLLHKAAESLKEITSITYKINRTDKHFSSKDTVSATALCSLYLAPKDKMGMYYIINTKVKPNTFNHERYNGKTYSFVNISKDASGSVKAKNFEFIDVTKQDYVSGNYNIKFLADEIFNSKSISEYNSFIKKQAVKKFIVRESVYSDMPIYELTIIHKNNKNRTGEVTNIIEKYYIRKTDFLPVGYVFNGDFEGMEGYENYTIEYIEINPKLTMEDFQVYTSKDEIDVKKLYDNITEHIF